MAENLSPVVLSTTTDVISPTSISSTDHDHDVNVIAAVLTTLGTTTTNVTSCTGVNINKAAATSTRRRGKVKMEKMKRENNLLVTFSKRKSGLMKKANELCTMCGVQCALLIFSPAGKVFSFGHPSVEQVADRYLISTNPNPQRRRHHNHHSNHVDDDHAVISVIDLMSELGELEAALEAVKKHGRELDDNRAMRMISCWWERRQLQELNGGQIETLKRGVVDLKSQVVLLEMAKLRTSLMPPLISTTTN